MTRLGHPPAIHPREPPETRQLFRNPQRENVSPKHWRVLCLIPESDATENWRGIVQNLWRTTFLCGKQRKTKKKSATDQVAHSSPILAWVGQFSPSKIRVNPRPKEKRRAWDSSSPFRPALHESERSLHPFQRVAREPFPLRRLLGVARIFLCSFHGCDRIPHQLPRLTVRLVFGFG